MRDARAGAAQGSGSDDAAAASQRDQAAAAEAEAAGAHEGRGPAAPNADSSGGAAAAAAASGDAASDGLPRGWQAALDPASGLVFYFHSSGLAQWERPRAAGGEGDEGREEDEDAGGADGGSGAGRGAVQIVLEKAEGVAADAPGQGDMICVLRWLVCGVGRARGW